MQSPRKITYVSVNTGNPSSVISGASTWQELKDENSDIAMKSAGHKAHIRETSTDITFGNQPLPHGDFTIYFLVEKNKSGK